jgi:hypothetical protein
MVWRMRGRLITACGGKGAKAEAPAERGRDKKKKNFAKFFSLLFEKDNQGLPQMFRGNRTPDY